MPATSPLLSLRTVVQRPISVPPSLADGVPRKLSVSISSLAYICILHWLTIFPSLPVKSFKAQLKGAAAPLIEIEIEASSAGPRVALHGDAAKIAAELGIESFEVSISHSDDVAIAVIVAKAKSV